MNKRIYTFWLFAALLAVSACKKPDFEAQQQAMAAGTVSDYLKNNFDFSLFAAAISKAGLTDTLNQTTAAFTVMAPTNTALNKDGIYNASDFDKWPADSLRYFIKSHILPIKLFYNTIPLSSDNRYDNLNNTRLYISRANDVLVSLIVNGVNVQKQPSLGSSTQGTYGITLLNGVVYPLPNTIKVMPGTVQAFLLARPYFSHLVAGLKKFGYWDQLATDGPFTLYAPMDSSFERRGMTLDSISRIDINHIDPVVFGGYFLKPNHLFVLDVLQLPPPNGVTYLAFQCPDTKYKLVMTQQPFGSGVGIVTAASTATRLLVAVGPNANMSYGLQGTLFLGETSNTNFLADLNGIYTNYTCTNGVVHLLSDLLVMPDKVSR